MSKWRVILAVAIGGLIASCGSWQRVGSEDTPRPEQVVPRLFDTEAVYRSMGMLAAPEPLPFVASVRFVAGPTPDSTLALVGVSIANRALSYRRAGAVHEARYRVEITFRREGHVIAQAAQEETVRVASFQETQRTDESVVFQRFMPVSNGATVVGVAIRDQFSGDYSRAEATLDVPRFDAGPHLSSLVPVYRATPRAVRDTSPDLVVNPRATVPYGSDTLRFYLEGYGLPADGVVRLRAFSSDDQGDELWSDSLDVSGARPLTAWVISVEPDSLPIGEVVVEASLGADTARTDALSSFSSQWVVGNFDQMLSLLRYFGQDRAIQQMREAPADQRPALWRAFWKATDPNPQTPEHEALEEYFSRLEEANERFRETGEPGWLTDRGEVFITLGRPDEIFNSSSDLQDQTGLRLIRWTYTAERITLDFVDETGFGRFRMTAESRSEYLQALNRLRRGD